MKKVFIPAIVIAFTALSAIFFYMQTALPAYRFNVLMGANIIMAVLSITSYLLASRQMHNRPEAFVRGVYSASIVKLMVCMFAMLIYVFMNKHNIHKPTVFVLFGIYAVYSAIENNFIIKDGKNEII